MVERLYNMPDPDTKEQITTAVINVPVSDGFKLDDYETVAKGTPPKDSPFKDNGKDGLFKSLDSSVPFNTNKLAGKWEEKETEPYEAMIGNTKVKVLGEKDYYIAKVPSLRVYYIEGSKPTLGRVVLPPEALSGQVETEVVVENGELVRKIKP